MATTRRIHATITAALLVLLISVTFATAFPSSDSAARARRHAHVGFDYTHASHVDEISTLLQTTKHTVVHPRKLSSSHDRYAPLAQHAHIIPSSQHGRELQLHTTHPHPAVVDYEVSVHGRWLRLRLKKNGGLFAHDYAETHHASDDDDDAVASANAGGSGVGFAGRVRHTANSAPTYTRASSLRTATRTASRGGGNTEHCYYTGVVTERRRRVDVAGDANVELYADDADADDDDDDGDGVYVHVVVGRAAIATCGGVHGVVRTRDTGEEWHIVPALRDNNSDNDNDNDNDNNKANDTSHVLFRGVDLPRATHDQWCGVTIADEASARAETIIVKDAADDDNGGGDRRLLQTPAATRFIGLLLVNDARRVNQKGQNTAAAAAFVANIVDSAYEGAGTNPPLRVTLVAQLFFSSGDPYEPRLQPNGVEVDVDSLLSLFQRWAINPRNLVPSHDNRHLLSGYDFADSTVGYAPVNAMCRSTSSGGINQGYGFFDTILASTVD
jgi:hypothetical protein